MRASHDTKPGWIALLVQAMVDGIRSLEWRPVSIGSRRFLANGIDRANGDFVRRIVAERQDARSAGQTPRRLVTFHDEFRRIAGRQRIAGLIHCLDASDPELLRLTIWLVARARAGHAIPAISAFRW